MQEQTKYDPSLTILVISIYWQLYNLQRFCNGVTLVLTSDNLKKYIIE